MSFFLAFETLASDRGVLVVSANPDYPPLSWRQGDKVVGAGIEIFQKAAKMVGLKIDSKYVGPWSRVQYNAKTGGIDAIAGLYKTADREQYLIFLEPPVLMDPVAIFVLKGNPKHYKMMEELKGKIGCTVKGNSQGEKFDKYANENLNLRLPNTVKDGLNMLINGHADYLIHGLYPGLAVMESEKINRRIDYSVPGFLPSEGLYIGISKKSPYAKYAPELQKAFDKLRKRGEVDRMMKKYLKVWAAKGPKEGVMID